MDLNSWQLFYVGVQTLGVRPIAVQEKKPFFKI